MQSREELERFYNTPDPWKYQENQDDILRKQHILSACKGNWKSALDVGAGEGWITKDLPAKKLYAYELSDNASKRLPESIQRVHEPTKAELVLASGVLYKQYNYEEIADIILKSATKRIVTCNIKGWEQDILPKEWEVSTFEFPYRKFIEVLRIYDVPTA